jgi:hypothetical protein
MPAMLVEIRDDIAYLTLNRPEVHNAINPELMVQLAEAWRRVAADDSVRVVILTGAGDKAFSAGADLARLLPLTTSKRPQRTYGTTLCLKIPSCVVSRCSIRSKCTSQSSRQSMDTASPAVWSWCSRLTFGSRPSTPVSA